MARSYARLDCPLNLSVRRKVKMTLGGMKTIPTREVFEAIFDLRFNYSMLCGMKSEQTCGWNKYSFV